MGHAIRWLLACWGASLRSALEYRASAVAQAAFMLLNNLLFLSFWAVFFARFPSAGGWTLKDVALCYAIAATGYGLCAVLLGGLADLAPSVSSGRLDSWLLRPRAALAQGLVSRMRLSGFGDIATGPVLLLLTGQTSRWAGFVAASLVAGLVLASFGVLCHSAAFWTGRADDMGSFGTMILVNFALHPPGIFVGPARVMLFVGIPAGLMSWLPAELVLRWDAGRAGALLLGVGAFAGAALLAWTRGLRRYESGNLTQAAGE